MASDSGSDHNGGENVRITVDSIMEAIGALKECSGSSLTSLKKYFASNSQTHAPASELSTQIKKALARGLREGKIQKAGKSRFTLGVDDDEGSKKSRRRRVLNDDDDDRPHRRRRSRRRGGRRRRSRRRGRGRRRRSRRRGRGRRRRSRRRVKGRRRRSRRRGKGRKRRRR
ncbi:protamine-like [Physella acuta]|uniref:protamine-like n=1 Tax=Physella acuta TaxID=109671 RepID=UPI0027DD5223|nr:protamine-like [Physella acuta]